MAALGSAHAATITFNTLVDENGTGASCSLREAIKAANTNQAYGGCAAGSANSTDEITGSFYRQTFTLNNAVAPNEGLRISSNIWLRIGYNTIKGSGYSKGIIVDPGANLTIEVATITGFTGYPIEVKGNAWINQCDITGNTGNPGSGGVYVASGAYAFIDNSSLRNNSGAIAGGLHNAGGIVYLTNSTVSGNKSVQVGGGVCTLNGGYTSIQNSTISGNRVTGASFEGGGIYNDSGSTTSIETSTIANNTSTGHGGGIYSAGGSVYLEMSILDGNNSIQQLTDGCSANVTSFGGNLLSHFKNGGNQCALWQNFVPADFPDTFGAFVNLGALTTVYNNYPAVHTPNAGSPAVDKIASNRCQYVSSRDQLGRARPKPYTLCDIGSIERQ